MDLKELVCSEVDWIELAHYRDRHWCELGDNLDRYTWVQHDGTNFGVQELEDGPFLFTTSYVKRLGGLHGGDWSARITVNTKVDNVSYLSTVAPGLHLLKETIISSLRLSSDKQTKKRRIVLPGEILPKGHDGIKLEPNFIATQVTGIVPFTLDVVFESSSFIERDETLFADTYTRELQRSQDEFHHRFEATFNLEKKGFSGEEILFAKAVLSNVIGGIGYFYGASRVESPYTRGPVPYWKAPLLTAVPSRSFFPRGFLWDEGFHGLLISTWDLDIELDIMGHWFDLMNVEGWIPREQILGQEALSKVPEEFVTQRNSNANPPTFFLTLQFILRNFANSLMDGEDRLGTLERLYPRLQAWFDWFNTTQIGEESGTYRWRGRDGTTNRELNPKTLTSGLDDYPRASHPNIDERHVDLRCWIAMAASALSEIAQLLNRNGNRYNNTFLYLSDNDFLDTLHWSPKSESYSDFGLHTDGVVLKRPPVPKTHSHHPQHKPEMIRVVTKAPELKFVDTTFGYVSLFPFLLQLLNPYSPKLGKILKDLQRPEFLWTEYGLRSLGKSSPLYMKRNTEHDPPYWRGPIWINMNYMAVRALDFYSHQDGPYRAEAGKLYAKLRHNVITNIHREYRRTGYVWEQYNDKTGEGQGSRPFTGWSALVVLLMAELY
uniref:Mannosyl-oligosaccharide glucosidase n=1 Tax=Timema californicum TaxID=61474 RepID=A0A7R9P7V8_TIMCA|nr:unnamed protein product [Timema californicum]